MGAGLQSFKETLHWKVCIKTLNARATLLSRQGPIPHLQLLHTNYTKNIQIQLQSQNEIEDMNRQTQSIHNFFKKMHSANNGKVRI